MNKQEVIEEVKGLSPNKRLSYTLRKDRYVDYSQGFEEARNLAIDIIKQLDEPQKVVIPKFVADWLEVCKDNLALNLANSMNNTVMRSNNQPDKTIHWLAKNSETFAKAWILGYEVEKEKLYFVRNSRGASLLTHDTKGNVIENYGWNKTVQRSEIEKFGLTEQEIKDFDERYFAFAVSVEDCLND